MTTGARELAYAVTVVGATLLGLASTMLGLFLDWPATAAVIGIVVAVGTLVLESNRAVAGLVGGQTALLAGLVVLVGLGTLSTTAFHSRGDAGPHA